MSQGGQVIHSYDWLELNLLAWPSCTAGLEKDNESMWIEKAP